MSWFSNCQTLEELKKLYKQLVFKNHPDRGGNEALMKQINAEYDKIFLNLQKSSTNKAEQTEHPDEYREIINELLKLNDIEIEICGAWLWISGETRKYKEILKELKCRWSSKKFVWYWRPAESACYGGNGSGKSMDEIRGKYGSTIIHSKSPKKLPGNDKR